MTEEIIFAGFGGQGVLLAGQVVTYAGMEAGKHVSWLPSYGPEMRGGTSNCSVVVSDEEVASPVVLDADSIVAMNRPSMEKFESAVKPGGVLVMNSDLIEIEPTRDDIKVIRIPANRQGTSGQPIWWLSGHSMPAVICLKMKKSSVRLQRSWESAKRN